MSMIHVERIDLDAPLGIKILSPGRPGGYCSAGGGALKGKSGFNGVTRAVGELFPPPPSPGAIPDASDRSQEDSGCWGELAAARCYDEVDQDLPGQKPSDKAADKPSTGTAGEKPATPAEKPSGTSEQKPSEPAEQPSQTAEPKPPVPGETAPEGATSKPQHSSPEAPQAVPPASPEGEPADRQPAGSDTSDTQSTPPTPAPRAADPSSVPVGKPAAPTPGQPHSNSGDAQTVTPSTSPSDSTAADRPLPAATAAAASGAVAPGSPSSGDSSPAPKPPVTPTTPETNANRPPEGALPPIRPADPVAPSTSGESVPPKSAEGSLHSTVTNTVDAMQLPAANRAHPTPSQEGGPLPAATAKPQTLSSGLAEIFGRPGGVHGGSSPVDSGLGAVGSLTTTATRVMPSMAPTGDKITDSAPSPTDLSNHLAGQAHRTNPRSGSTPGVPGGAPEGQALPTILRPGDVCPAHPPDTKPTTTAPGQSFDNTGSYSSQASGTFGPKVFTEAMASLMNDVRRPGGGGSPAPLPDVHNNDHNNATQLSTIFRPTSTGGGSPGEHGSVGQLHGFTEPKLPSVYNQLSNVFKPVDQGDYNNSAYQQLQNIGRPSDRVPSPAVYPQEVTFGKKIEALLRPSDPDDFQNPSNILRPPSVMPAEPRPLLNVRPEVQSSLLPSVNPVKFESNGSRPASDSSSSTPVEPSRPAPAAYSGALTEPRPPQQIIGANGTPVIGADLGSLAGKPVFDPVTGQLLRTSVPGEVSNLGLLPNSGKPMSAAEALKTGQVEAVRLQDLMNAARPDGKGMVPGEKGAVRMSDLAGLKLPVGEKPAGKGVELTALAGKDVVLGAKGELIPGAKVVGEVGLGAKGELVPGGKALPVDLLGARGELIPGGKAHPGEVPAGKRNPEGVDITGMAAKPGDRKEITDRIKEGKEKEDEKPNSKELLDTMIMTSKKGVKDKVKDNKEQKADAKTEQKKPEQRRKYIVRQGDTVESIAAEQLGDSKFSVLICIINRASIHFTWEGAVRKAHLRVGQTIWLPTSNELNVHRSLFFADKRTSENTEEAAPGRQWGNRGVAESEAQTNELAEEFELPEMEISDETEMLDEATDAQIGNSETVRLHEISASGEASVILPETEELSMETGPKPAHTASAATPSQITAVLYALRRAGRRPSITLDLPVPPKAGQEAELLNKMKETVEQTETLSSAAMQYPQSYTSVQKFGVTCRLMRLDHHRETEFHTKLQLKVDSDWVTIASYEFRDGRGVRKLWAKDGTTQSFNLNLPMVIIKQMASEDFARFWHNYVQFYEDSTSAVFDTVIAK